MRPIPTTLLWTTLLLGSGVVLDAGPVRASSHREAPGIAGDPAADNTDVYAFVSPDAPNTITLIANYFPAEEPGGGPNFYGFADADLYDIHIDNDGDGVADIVYRFDFATQTMNPATFLYNTGPITALNDPDFNVRQTYDLTRLNDGIPQSLGTGLPVPPVNIGPASTPDYANLSLTAIRTLPDGSKVFVGQRDDPFFVDLGAVFDLLSIRPGAPGNAGGGRDGLGGFNCQTVALQIPVALLTRDGSTPADPASAAAVIGVWATASRPAVRTLHADGSAPDYSGAPVQVSRLGMPLVNEIVLPLAEKDIWNGSQPSGDGQFLSYVLDPEPARLLHAIYGISVPPPPRNDLVAVFLTGVAGLNQPAGVTPAEELRLNVAIHPAAVESRLGVLAGDNAGFPNGRRLMDDVVDIELRAVAGVLVPGYNISPNNALGDGVDVNDMPFLASFPYVSTPHQGFLHSGHRDEPIHPVPVTLEFMNATVVDDGVRLDWKTSAEVQAVGFRIERNSELINSELVQAHGTPGVYTFLDHPATEGHLRYTLVEVARDGKLTEVGVKELDYRPAGLTPRLELAQNYPNPVRSAASIPFRLAAAGDARITFFDASGRLMHTQEMKGLSAGAHEQSIDAGDWPAGVYFYRLEAGDAVLSRSLRVVR